MDGFSRFRKTGKIMNEKIFFEDIIQNVVQKIKSQKVQKIKRQEDGIRNFILFLNGVLIGKDRIGKV